MADRLYRRAVVPTEIGNGLEIRRVLSRQPHAFDIAPRFALQSPARLHPVQIAVEIELEHCRRAIPGSAGCGRPGKAKRWQIQFVDEYIHHPDQVLFVDIVIQTIGRAGDVVVCPPGEKHWHGATATTGMSHIAIQEALDGKVVEWLEKVSDEEYLAAPRERTN